MAIEISKESIGKYETDLSKVITRCYSNSISPEKWNSFIHQTKNKHFEDSPISPRLNASLARVLLSHILASSPPPVLLLRYLRFAILASTAESSPHSASRNDTFISSKDALLAMLAACTSSYQDAEDNQTSTSLQSASVEAVCKELESLGLSILLDSEESLLHLYRAIHSDVKPPHHSSPTLALVKAAASLFLTSFSHETNLVSRTLAIQILSTPAHRSLCRETELVRLNRTDESKSEATESCKIIEKCLALCETLDLKGEASCFQSIRKFLLDLGAVSSSKVSASSQEKNQLRFHPNLKISLANQWTSESDGLNALLLRRESTNFDLMSWDPDYGPEILILLQVLVSERCSFTSKVDSARVLLRAQVAEGTDVSTAHTRFYLSLLLEATRLVAATDAERTRDPTKEFVTPGGTRPSRFRSEASLWIDVLVGLLPQIFLTLESERVASESSSGGCSACVGKAVKALFAIGNETLSACETKHASKSDTSEGIIDGDVAMKDLLLDTDSQSRRPLRAYLLRSFRELGLIEQEMMDQLTQNNEVISQDLASLGPSFRSESASSMQFSDSHLNPLQSYLSQILLGGDFTDLLDRIGSDYDAQLDFAAQLSQAISTWTSSTESQIDTLSQICKTLGENTASLDAVMLYVAPREILGNLASLFDREDLGQLSDEPLTHGGILLFVQFCIQRYALQDDLHLHLAGSRFLPRLLRSMSETHFLSSLSSEDRSLIERWITALFDSEGIPDELIRTSSPQALLRLAPTLASQCIRACAAGLIDLDTLKSGLTYFCNPILSWTLPGVLSMLLQDLTSWPAFSVSASSIPSSNVRSNGQTLRVASTDGIKRKVVLETLCMLLVNEGCPSLALQFVSHDIPTVIRETESLSSELSEGGHSDLAALKLKAEGFVGMRLHLSVSINRLLARGMPSSLSQVLSSPRLSTSIVQSFASHLVSATILSLHTPQISQAQKAIASKLVLASGSLNYLKEFIQIVPLDDGCDSAGSSPAQVSLVQFRSQAVAQTILLAFELAQRSDELTSLGEILALRLARIQAHTNSLPLIAQILLTVSSPLSLVQPLRIVFSSSIEPQTS